MKSLLVLLLLLENSLGKGCEKLIVPHHKLTVAERAYSAHGEQLPIHIQAYIAQLRKRMYSDGCLVNI